MLIFCTCNIYFVYKNFYENLHFSFFIWMTPETLGTVFHQAERFKMKRRLQGLNLELFSC